MMSYVNFYNGTVLVLVALAFHSANGAVYYVAPNVTDYSVNASCNTINYYANSAALPLTNSVFYFMPGIHLLEQTWVMENVSNLTLTRALPKSEPNGEVIIDCRDSYGRGLRVINS